MTAILAVVAHPDDEIIGPGGALAAHAQRGDDVHVLILADGKTSRDEFRTPEYVRLSEAETSAAAAQLQIATYRRLNLSDNRLDEYPLLELAQAVTDMVEAIAPRVVYTHHQGDLNVDHELTARACMIACRPQVSPVEWVLGFSTLSATDPGFGARPHFTPTVYADISDRLEDKLAAMSCYQSELREAPHPRSLHVIQIQAELWGAHVGYQAAEAFSVLRGTWNPGASTLGTDDHALPTRNDEGALQ